MFECLTKINWKKVGLFASGTLFGTAGIKVLASDDAKKVYTNCTAAVLRAKETVMNIYEGAKQINEERAEAKVAAEFAAEAEEEETEETTEDSEAETTEAEETAEEK